MGETSDEGNQRLQTLKAMIRNLHPGEPVEEARARLRALVEDCRPSDVAAMEEELLAEGLPPARLVARCDLHARVVCGAMAPDAAFALPAGHPLDVFRRENEALRGVIALLRARLASLEGEADDAPVVPALLGELNELCRSLGEVHKHYQRKELLLFPLLERRGITGPSIVMRDKDGQVRALLADLQAALPETPATAGECRLVARSVAEPALSALEEMFLKEEHILFPLALQTLTGAEWDALAEQSAGIGYCLVDPRAG
jgi:DUF438 domain-containing protein